MSSRFVHAAIRAILACSLIPPAASPQGVIVTIAGADAIFPGDGRPAFDAPLGALTGVDADLRGNLYIADQENHRVMRISRDGILTVVAGNGLPGFSGDGGPARNASLSIPTGVAVDPAGNLYISEIGNRRVRRVTPEGIISTIAGNGQGSSLGDGGPATVASLGGRPFALAFDPAGNLYIGDPDAHRIRRVSPQGVITTVAGTGQPGFSGDGGPATQAQLSSPVGVACDSSGNLYIADGANFRIRRVTPSGIISTIAGGGLSAAEGVPATSAALVPFGIAVSADGGVYVTDLQNYRVRRVSPAGTIQTVAGNGQQGFSGDGGLALAATANSPTAIAFDPAGNLYFTDRATFRLRRVTPAGVITTVAGNGQFRAFRDGILATDAPLRSPDGVGVDAAGNVYFAERDRGRIRQVAPNGIVSTVAGTGEHGFFGDNGPARNALLSFPRGLFADPSGALYFSDGFNHRVRSVTPGGVINTVAGNGIPSFSGDGGPATGASVILSEGVTRDAAGNLYIAIPLSQRVRRVTPAGVITTFAGTGQSGFSGDGGQASAATLSSPFGVAADAAGNVYIADTSNHRIRRVAPTGVITTVAGNGRPAFSGDGGPAILASLNFPSKVAVDAQGNLYIADQQNERIRKVTADGVITTIAGNGRAGAAGDGGPATEASLNSPNGVAVDAAGNVYISDQGNSRIRVVLTAPPTLSASPASLSFTANSTGPPTPAQDISVAGSVPGIPFTVTAAVEGGGSWLTVNLDRGASPADVKVTADPASLRPGVYNATITISAPNARPAVQTIAVRFRVDDPIPPRLDAIARGFSLTVLEGSPAVSTPMGLTNLGGGSIPFRLSAATASGGSWLTVSAQEGFASAAQPAILRLTVDPRGLRVGTYSGAISVSGTQTGENFDLPVTMTVTPVRQTVQLTSSGLTFTTVQGGGVVPSQRFGIANSGQGVMGWSVVASTLSGSRTWLSATPGGGSSTGGGSVPEVDVSVNPLGLAAGVYYGRILVLAEGAENSPQSVTVVLNVLPPFSNPGPLVQPAGLIFTAAAGGSSPGSQEILVYNPSDRPLSYTSGRLTLDGRNWFVHLPATATILPDQPARILVQPDVTGLAAGVYRGVLTLLFSDGSVRTINQLFVVRPSAVETRNGSRRNATGCTPTRLLPLVTSHPTDFIAPASWPTALQVRVVDDCGDPLVRGSVAAAFSNGDPPLTFTSLGDGRWGGTWVVRNSRQPQVSISVLAEDPSNRLSNLIVLPGVVRGEANAPLLAPGAVVSAASLRPRVPLAPGSLISIFGNRLAERRTVSSSLPLDVVLGGVSVAIAGRPLPLQFVNQDQINAVIPYDLPVNTTQQLVITTGASITVPEAVAVAAAQPAIFTLDGSGSGQGLIYRGADALADARAPAAAGDEIVIYCSGLGAVSPELRAGAAPAGPGIHSAVHPVTVTVAGAAAEVVWAGLSPQGAGLYEVRAKVPAGISPGDAVPVVLSAAGQVSPAVTMAVR